MHLLLFFLTLELLSINMAAGSRYWLQSLLVDKLKWCRRSRLCVANFHLFFDPVWAESIVGCNWELNFDVVFQWAWFDVVFSHVFDKFELLGSYLMVWNDDLSLGDNKIDFVGSNCCNPLGWLILHQEFWFEDLVNVRRLTFLQFCRCFAV